MKHILIDFENIQPTSLDSLDDPENYQIWLFLGVHQQKTLPYPLTKSLFRFANQNVHFIEMQRMGKNALDHYLAFYLGKISEIDHHAQICILAKDGGYDILVEHLNATHHGLYIQRFSDIQYLDMTQKPVMIDLSITVPQIKEIATTSEMSQDLLPPIPTTQTQEISLLAAAYQHVFSQLKSRLDNHDFVPSKKANFLSALQKYFLADFHKDWQNDEPLLFAEKLFSRLINYGLIKLKDDSTTLIFQFSDSDLRENIAKRVLSAKPKTADKLKNVLKSQMALLQMPTDEPSLNQMLHWLKQKSYIYQIDEKISYTPPDTQPQAVQQNAVSNSVVSNQNTSNALVTKVITLLKGKFAKNRPTKIPALVTVLTNQLKLSEKQAQQVIMDLEKSKKLTIPSQGKILYHL